MHLLAPCAKATTEGLRVRINCSQELFSIYTNTIKLICRSFFAKMIDESNQERSLLYDQINVVCEQLAGFIMREILETSSTTTVTTTEYPLRHREGLSIWTINMTCTFVNISKSDVMLFVYL